MGAAYFYQLTERPLEATLPTLLEKALAAGWRVEVRGVDAARMARLDQMLWQREGFLPHGVAGGPHDRDQPVLLTHDRKAENVACVMAIDGAEFQPEEVEKSSRFCVLFDGSDPDSLERARAQWRAVSDAGVEAQYWAEDGGRWVKKAENSPQKPTSV